MKTQSAYVKRLMSSFGAMDLPTEPDDVLRELREALLGVVEEVDEEVERRARIDARHDHYVHDAYDREGDR